MPRRRVDRGKFGWASETFPLAQLDMEQPDDDLDDSFNSGTPAAPALESLIAKLSEFVQRCAPAGEATELNEQLWSLQGQVKLLTANGGGSGTRGSRSATRRMSSEKKKQKKKKKKTEASCLAKPNPTPHPALPRALTRALTRALNRALTRALNRALTRALTRALIRARV